MGTMTLTYGEETVSIYSDAKHAAIFHHFPSFLFESGTDCRHVTASPGKDGKLVPVGILFGVDDTKRTAKAEAVVKFVDGVPMIERKGLRVKVS